MLHKNINFDVVRVGFWFFFVQKLSQYDVLARYEVASSQKISKDIRPRGPTSIQVRYINTGLQPVFSFVTDIPRYTRRDYRDTYIIIITMPDEINAHRNRLDVFGPCSRSDYAFQCPYSRKYIISEKKKNVLLWVGTYGQKIFEKKKQPKIISIVVRSYPSSIVIIVVNMVKFY